MWSHGVNDYGKLIRNSRLDTRRTLTRVLVFAGGKFSMHAEKFLPKGYSICAVDLPSHGRSTGIHVYAAPLSLPILPPALATDIASLHSAQAPS